MDLDERMRRACWAKAGEIGLLKPEVRELAMNRMGCSLSAATEPERVVRFPQLRDMLLTLDGFVVVSELLALRPSTQAILEAQRQRLRGGG